MKFTIRLFTLALFLVWTQFVCAQTKNTTTKKVKHQLEYGLDYMNYYSNYKRDFKGWGYTAYVGFNLNSTYSLNYKCIIKDKHVIRFGFSRYYSANEYPDYPQLGKVGFTLGNLSLGYGYMFAFKNLFVSAHGAVNYRYTGGEAAISAWSEDPNFKEVNFVDLRYKAPFGFGSGIELEYFFIKNLGIGINAYLNYFPFEDAKFRGYFDDEKAFNSIYKPNDLYVTTTFKLAYKFSFPNFKKTQ